MGVKNNVSSPEVCTHNAGGQLPTRQCIWESPVLGGRLHSTDVNLAIFVNNSSAIFNLHFLIHLHGDGRVGEIFSLLTCMRQTRWNVSFVTFGQMCVLSCVQLFVTPWIVACQAPLSMGFSRQEYRTRFPFPPPGDLPDPGIKPASPVSPALTGRFFTTEPSGKPHYVSYLKLMLSINYTSI